MKILVFLYIFSYKLSRMLTDLLYNNFNIVLGLFIAFDCTRDLYVRQLECVALLCCCTCSCLSRESSSYSSTA